ncbi:terpene synthase 17-like isoform X2 [Magnolia sinica]|uniref:terpene synthase 17-like isoform X2 n=1 Tax=Magnolia sinica TaxID=86752 RepID=UPI0026589D49|nr:terpene synthase 17-like isoform X2 [Magnolia sinica]
MFSYATDHGTNTIYAKCRRLATFRWELEATEGLPYYMKARYLALVNTVDEIESHMMPDEKFHHTNYIKREEFTPIQLQEVLKIHLPISSPSSGTEQ